MSSVPRVAAFDDLRVGQWVAYLADDDSVLGGRVERASHIAVDVKMSGGLHYSLLRETYPDGVAILRDAPEPPVTVRREDFDDP